MSKFWLCILKTILDYGILHREPVEGDRRGEMEQDLLLLSDTGKATVHSTDLWRQQVYAIARMHFLNLKRETKIWVSLWVLHNYMISVKCVCFKTCQEYMPDVMMGQARWDREPSVLKRWDFLLIEKAGLGGEWFLSQRTHTALLNLASLLPALLCSAAFWEGISHHQILLWELFYMSWDILEKLKFVWQRWESTCTWKYCSFISVI